MMNKVLQVIQEGQQDQVDQRDQQYPEEIQIWFSDWFLMLFIKESIV